MINQIVEKIRDHIKDQHLNGDEIDEFLIEHILGSGATLVALSPMHEEEGVYEIKFSFKLNTKEMSIEPLGGLKLEKLRGKTND